jgi:DNA-binding CsgD family transcriptional regulator
MREQPTRGCVRLLSGLRSEKTELITETSTYHERTFAEVKRLSLAGLEGPELLSRTAERLKLAVSFEAYCLATFDPASNLMTGRTDGGYPSEEERAKAEPIAALAYFEEDLDRIYSMLRERRPVQPLSETTGGELDLSFRYREYLKPLGFGHELGAVFADKNLWGGGYLMREAGDHDFSSMEVALLERIAPHVGAGLKAAALRSRAVAEPVTNDIPGVLTLNRSGRVVSHTPAVEHWLHDLNPTWRERGLPVAIIMVAGALERALNPRSDRDLNLVPRLRVRGRSGRWLALYASLSEPVDGRPSETVIVVEPAKPEEVAWLNVAAYGLSPREEEVVGLVVRGLSNRQVSQTLYISENTVQRHLSNIFEKVGVRSRKELPKRLFFENLLPGIVGN